MDSNFFFRFFLQPLDAGWAREWSLDECEKILFVLPLNKLIVDRLVQFNFQSGPTWSVWFRIHRWAETLRPEAHTNDSIQSPAVCVRCKSGAMSCLWLFYRIKESADEDILGAFAGIAPDAFVVRLLLDEQIQHFCRSHYRNMVSNGNRNDFRCRVQRNGWVVPSHRRWNNVISSLIFVFISFPFFCISVSQAIPSCRRFNKIFSYFCMWKTLKCHFGVRSLRRLWCAALRLQSSLSMAQVTIQ